MANIILKLTPKPARGGKEAVTHHTVAQGIKIRSLIIDGQDDKKKVEAEILNEIKKYMAAPVWQGIDTKALAGVPAKDWAGSHALFLFVGEDKAAKIDLTIEEKPPFDIKGKCPLFANTKGKKADKEYCGGAADEPHVHVYASGFHLKLGSHRYNIVQSNTLYESAIQDAHAALKSHAKKDELAPFVAAGLKKFGFID